MDYFYHIIMEYIVQHRKWHRVNTGRVVFTTYPFQMGLNIGPVTLVLRPNGPYAEKTSVINETFLKNVNYYLYTYILLLFFSHVIL